MVGDGQYFFLAAAFYFLTRFQRLLFPGLAAAAPPAYKNGQLRL
jgi:hypothetical protein